jgi:hypothetical protein
MTNKVLLGRMKSDSELYAGGENCYLNKHEWDCGWYWGFGYLGNKNCHFHFDSLLYNVKIEGKNVQWPLATDLFSYTEITDKEWWVIRDLFTQAYALKKCAEVYRYGGHNTHLAGVTDIIKNEEMEDKVNADLKTILDALWAYVVEAVKPKTNV